MADWQWPLRGSTATDTQPGLSGKNLPDGTSLKELQESAWFPPHGGEDFVVMTRVSLAVVLILFLGPDLTIADETNWTQFRGPGGSGVSESFKPPVEIGPSKLAWKTPVPSGLSSPVLAGDRLFLTAFEKERLLTIAIDRRNGRELWRRMAPEGPLQKVHKANNSASPSALADAENVYVYFGSYGLIAYRHDGTEIWKKPLEASRSLYGASTSPIAYRNLLILVIDDDANLEKNTL